MRKSTWLWLEVALLALAGLGLGLLLGHATLSSFLNWPYPLLDPAARRSAGAIASAIALALPLGFVLAALASRHPGWLRLGLAFLVPWLLGFAYVTVGLA